MKILYVADARSPIARNWMSFFAERGHEVHLVSTYPGVPGFKVASYTLISLPLSRFTPGSVASSKNITPRTGQNPGGEVANLRRWLTPGLRISLRHWFVPPGLPRAATQLQKVIDQVQPEIIHALRIPYEGMLAAETNPSQPLLVSVWGNDFTLHASSTPGMRRLTRQTLQRAVGLHADCRRDLRLAREWGYPDGRASVVLPGNGGVRTDIFYLMQGEDSGRSGHEEQPTVINPRGIRAYVRNDTFFRAIPEILAKRPEVRFLCPAMAGESLAEVWLRRLKIGASVELLPKIQHEQMAGLFRKAQVAVSITMHDGTPNTLLEALACGCFPIAGEIESVQEWIEPGVNGFLVDPSDPEALAKAILLAFDQPYLRHKAQEINTRLVAERADYRRVMEQAEAFYCSLV